MQVVRSGQLMCPVTESNPGLMVSPSSTILTAYVCVSCVLKKIHFVGISSSIIVLTFIPLSCLYNGMWQQQGMDVFVKKTYLHHHHLPTIYAYCTTFTQKIICIIYKKMCTMCNVCMQSQRNVVISLEYVYTHTSTTTVHIKVTQTHAGSDGMCVK